MSRRLAIILAIVAVAIFGVVYFWPEEARAGSISGRLHLGDARVLGDARIGLNGAVGGVRWSDGKDRDRWDDRRRKDHDRWDRHRDRRDRHGRRGFHGHWPRPVVVIGPDVEERVIERETIIVPQATVAAPPPVTQAPPPPLDPQGTARTVSARGVERPREWVLGAALPPDLPYVTLEPSAYGLPPPPDGQIYARVEGDVLRIEPGTRRILAVLAR